MDLINFRPGDVRGGGNIVSPSKTLTDFDVSDSVLTSVSDTVDGKTVSVFNLGYRSGSYFTVSYTQWVRPETEEFTLVATLKYHTGNVIYGATVTCTVNEDTVLSGTTDQSGKVSFTVPCTDYYVYSCRITYDGNNNVSGCTKRVTVRLGEINNIDLIGEDIYTTLDVSRWLLATVTGRDGDYNTMPIPYTQVSFYEVYTLAVRLSQWKKIALNNSVVPFTASLVDKNDGNLLMLPNETVSFYEVFTRDRVLLDCDKSVFTTDDVVTLSSTVLDIDGSHIRDVPVYFEEEVSGDYTITGLTGNNVLVGDTTSVSATVNGTSDVEGLFVRFYVDEPEGVDREVIIPVVPPVPTTLSVSSSKDILYDSESATLTALVKDQNGSPMSGQTVVFKKGSSTLATETTDSNGVATYTYTADGSGDVTITVECESLTQTQTIEDCINYDSLTSASGKWTIPSGVTSEYSSNGWKVSANAYKQVKLTDKLTSDCSVEFTVVDYDSSNMSSYPPVIIYAYTNGETTPNQLLLMNTSASAFTALTNTINHAMVKGAVYKIEYTSSTISVYENGTLLATANSSVGLPTRFEFHMGANGRYAIYKDLKVKPL